MLLPLPMRAAARAPAAPSSPSFDPATIASTPGWWDAQDAATITEASSSVSAWSNKGTAGGNATTAGNFPVYSETAVNNLPGILFSTGGLAVSETLAASAGNGSIFAVVEGVVPEAQIKWIFDTITGRLGFGQNSGDWMFFESTFRYPGPTDADADPHLVALIWSSGGTSMRVDGVEIGTAAGFTRAISGQTCIGARYDNAAFPLEAAIGELIVCDEALSGSPLSEMESGILAKWGLS